MPRYRKKPVVIEAEQFDGTEECAKRLGLDSQHVLGENPYEDLLEPKRGIETLEGFMIAEPGDWIITGVKGERYPCKPDVFEMTYEPTDGSWDPVRDERKPMTMREWGSSLREAVLDYVDELADQNEFTRGKHPWEEWMRAFVRFMSW